MSETSLPPAVATVEASEEANQASTLPVPPPISPEKTLGPAQWGMLSFLISEAAFFSTLIVAYLTFLGKDKIGPTPSEALSLPLVLATTTCLLSSSGTVHLAEKALHRGAQARFCLWWAITIVLGLVFLLGTAYEWNELIGRHHLTIDRNLFGTTYYTLVGFHGLHVSLGVLAMLTVLGLAIRRQVTTNNRGGIELVSWYWHFVDGVWVVVFAVVYLIGR